MSYKVEVFSNGHASLMDEQAGETMHSRIGPWEEAHLIYIQQSQLADRLMREMSDPLVLYDVGLGIGANAVAAVHTFLNQPHRRDLHLISFENQLNGICSGLQNLEHFSFLKPYLESIEELLEKRKIKIESTSGKQIIWELYEGDFQKTVLCAPEPELIFYDFYSPKSNSTLWGQSIFELLYKKTLNRRSQGLETLLYTYCSATAARTALLLAGFYVGHGVSTPGKKDTTAASTIRSCLLRPLAEEWILHLQRSGKPLPGDCLASLSEVLKKIQNQLLNTKK